MNRTRFTAGLLILAAGVLLLLDTLAVVDGTRVVASWWPVAFLAFALAAVTDRPPNYSAAAVLSVVGLVMLNGTLSVVPNIWGLLWPLVLVGAGVWFVVGATRSRPQPPPPRVPWVDHKAAPWGDHDTLQATALFSSRRVVSAADPFLRGTAVALFGGVELDLRDARLPREGAFLDATAVFGGVEITVPPGWRLVVTGPALFGGTEDNSGALGAPPPDAPVLTVRSFALFGGVEVKAAWPTVPPGTVATASAEHAAAGR